MLSTKTEKKQMIRNFIYVDNDKLQSLSSQIFEGVIQQTVTSRMENRSEQEQQKGPLASGRLLGDIFSLGTATTETKFLADHAVTLLEAKLLADDLIAEAPTGVLAEDSKSFVKFKSQVQFVDMPAVTKLLTNFNDLSLSLWRAINESMTYGDKILSDGEAKKRAGEAQMQVNEKVAKSAADVIDYGFGDLLELFMPLGNYMISAPMKREFLRETEQSLIHKYSRSPQVEFTVLGTVTRVFGDDHRVDIPNVADAKDTSTAMRYLALHMETMERQFRSVGDREITIDPIAIYSEL